MNDVDMEEVRRWLAEGIPFNRFLGIELVGMRSGFAAAELPFRAEFVGDATRPALHGGVVSTIIDFTGGAAAWSGCGLDARVSTIDLRVDYLKPARLEALRCEARVVRSGNRVSVVDVIAFHGEERAEPVATGKAVYNIKRHHGGK